MRNALFSAGFGVALVLASACAALRPTSLADLSYDSKELGGMWLEPGKKTFAEDWVKRLAEWKKDGKFAGAWTLDGPQFTVTGLAGEFPELEWRLNDGAPAVVVAKPGWGQPEEPWRARLLTKGLVADRFDGTLHRTDRPGAAPELLYELHELNAYAVVSEGKLLGIARIVALPRPPPNAPFDAWKPPSTFWYRRWSDMHEALKWSRNNRGVAATHALAEAAGLSQVAPLLPGSHPFPEEMRRDAGWWLSDLRAEGAPALASLSAELSAACDAALRVGTPLESSVSVRRLNAVVKRFAGLVPVAQQRLLDETKTVLLPRLHTLAEAHDTAGRTGSAVVLLTAAHELSGDPLPPPESLQAARRGPEPRSPIGWARRFAAQLVGQVLPVIVAPPVDADALVSEGAWSSLGIKLGAGATFAEALGGAEVARLQAVVGPGQGRLDATTSVQQEEVATAGVEVANPAYSPWKAGLDEVARRLSELELRLEQVPAIPDGDSGGPTWTNERKDAVRAERALLEQRQQATRLELERVRLQEPPLRVVQGGQARVRVPVKLQRWSGRITRRVELPGTAAPLVMTQGRDAPARAFARSDADPSVGLAARDDWKTETQLREALVAEMEAALAQDLVPLVRAEVVRRIEARVARLGAAWTEAERAAEVGALVHLMVRRAGE